MNRSLLWKIIVGIFVVFGCLFLNFRSDKIAVIDFEKVVAGHPQHKRLVHGEAVYKSLVEKRQDQENVARTQMRNLMKLYELRDMSERSYLEADFNTRMAEQQVIENERLEQYYHETEADAEEVVGEHKKELENEYQLRMFNIRMQMQSLKLTPEEKRNAERELQSVKGERDQRMQEIENVKMGIIAERMQPRIDEAHANLREVADGLNQDIMEKLGVSEGKYNKMMNDAPRAIKEALNIMDREIARQEERNRQILDKMTVDIASAVEKVAKDNRCTVVFKEYKVNVKADDITDDVIAIMRKENNEENK